MQTGCTFRDAERPFLINCDFRNNETNKQRPSLIEKSHFTRIFVNESFKGRGVFFPFK